MSDSNCQNWLELTFDLVSMERSDYMTEWCGLYLNENQIYGARKTLELSVGDLNNNFVKLSNGVS